MTKTDYKRILIIKPSALGDIAIALPALSSLRSSFPDAMISWLVRPEFVPLLRLTDNVDELLIFDRRQLGSWWYNPASFWKLIKLFRMLRRGRFDLVVDLQGLFRTAFLGWATGCKRRFGSARAREFAALFYTHRVRPCADSLHVIDSYLDIVSAAGAEVLTTNYGLKPTDEDIRNVKQLLADNGIADNRYAVMVTGSSHGLKCWPIEKFAALGERINAELGLSLVAVGTEGEKPVNDRLQSLCGKTVVNLTGRTNIAQLAALLKNAGVVVSNDTGPGHIAAALEAPLVIVFGPTNPTRINPYHREDAFAAIDPEGRGTAINDYQPEYRIDRVPVELVFDKVVRQAN